MGNSVFTEDRRFRVWNASGKTDGKTIVAKTLKEAVEKYAGCECKYVSGYRYTSNNIATFFALDGSCRSIRIHELPWE